MPPPTLPPPHTRQVRPFVPTPSARRPPPPHPAPQQTPKPPIFPVLLVNFHPLYKNFHIKNFLWDHYRGMFPCFLAGFESLLLDNISRALIKRGLVSRGSITSSI